MRPGDSGVSGSAQTIGTEPVPDDEEPYNFGCPGCGELPVRGKLGVVDGGVIGVALDPQAIITLAEDAGDAVEGGLGGGFHLGRAALEKAHLAQTDDQAIRVALQEDFLALDFGNERGFQFGLQLSQIAVLHAGTQLAIGARCYPAQARGALRVFDTLRNAEGHGHCQVDRHFRRGSLKDSHLLESDLNGQSQPSDFSFVDLRRSVKHDKEGKHEGDEIGVGNQPAFVTDVTGASLAASHGLDSPGTSSDSWASVRNPRSFASSIRGFIPSRMETTPPRVISRMMCS